MWKIADFGIAYVLRTLNQIIKEQIGTPGYMAPEMVQGRGYTTQADMYSFGVVLNVAHQRDNAISSPQWMAARTSLMNQNPNVRWTARELYRKSKEALEIRKGAGRNLQKPRPAININRQLSQLRSSFSVLRVNSQGKLVNGDTSNITFAILRQTAQVMRRFKHTTKRGIKGIQYIWNPELYADFDAAKEELKHKGRYKNGEILTFHGTDPKNVARYMLHIR